MLEIFSTNEVLVIHSKKRERIKSFSFLGDVFYQGKNLDKTYFFTVDDTEITFSIGKKGTFICIPFDCLKSNKDLQDFLFNVNKNVYYDYNSWLVTMND